MASLRKEFENLGIQLEEIKSATNNFSEENVIGHGGFGKVYKGELSHSHSEGKSMVAIKRLDRGRGQGDSEFHKEVRMLSCYRHENIISLLGFSSGREEMILIYEYASRGSLDGHLKDVTLTWTQRIRICLDAAKGLCYLHDPRETYQRLIHCDIKSANILLDDNFKAKVADFGLSKIGPANQQNSILVTGASGTHGYIDPVYMETYTLTKESDVYSFGVVLFEVLSGKLCFEFSNGQLKILVPMWKRSYEQKQLSGIVFQGLTEQMNQDSLETFADIAYKCLMRFREERPSMSLVVEKLEESLALQELHDSGLPKEYEEIAKAAVPPLIYRSLDELKVLLTKGFHVNEGKTRWLSANEKGEHIERIYIQSCLNPDEIKARDYLDRPLKHYDIDNSRFPVGLCYNYLFYHGFKARVRGQYLTPHISYTVNLVFRYEYHLPNRFETSWMVHNLPNISYDPLRYKIQGEDVTKVVLIYPTDMSQDGWFIVPLYHFTSQHTTADLQFGFQGRSITLLVAGIEFQPSEEKVELQVFEEYQHILKFASQSLVYRSLEELKHILRIGIHLKDYKTWFSLNKKGQHCEMISMKDCLIPNEDFTPRYQSDLRSRFPAGLYETHRKGFKTHVKTKLLSPLITYTVNLVFGGYCPEEEYIDFKYRLKGETTTSTVYLANTRQAGLFCVAELYQFNSDGSIVDIEIDFEDHRTNIQVEGISFEPLEKVELQVLEECQDIVEATSQSLTYISLEELKQILRIGIHLKDYKTWSSLNKKGEHYEMMSMKHCLISNEEFTPQYKFPAGLYNMEQKGFRTHVKTQLLNPLIPYTVNLVLYHSSFDDEAYVDLKYRVNGETRTSNVYLAKRGGDHLLWRIVSSH
ncbi:kinase-like domain, phloem protein 2-like protein [Tanacetum coccineum]|uniref:Kinase-like domain, phloem protein 2-like protein n=1 Tax=Tanacetum coccineum TaxID=301880 RepID=A0ABQ5B0P6_9ASTR